MMDVIKNNKTVILSAVVAFLIGVGFLIYYFDYRVPSIKKLENEYYSLQYDSTWRLVQKKKDKTILQHNSGSLITFQILELDDEYRYLSIDEIVDEILYNIRKQNDSYHLLFQERGEITRYYFDGYKLLYENDNRQVMVYVYKKSNKLVSVKYEANSHYFDMLLDSVNTIIYNLNVKDSNYSLNNTIQLDTTSVEYSDNKKLDELLKNRKSYEIAKNNYYVKYSIPDSFVLNYIDSTNGSFDLKMGDNRISLKVDVYRQNIFEYLDKENSTNVYKNYDLYHKENDDDYSDFKESLAIFKSKYNSYIYHNTFIYNKAVRYKESKKEEYKRNDEFIELIYELDNNHILVMKIGSTGIPITEKFIQMIEINESNNYASYIKNEKNDHFLIGRLQRLSSNKKKVEQVILKVPDVYQEEDRNTNLYLKRYYGYNYHNDTELYDYNVYYELSPLTEDSILKVINNSIHTKLAFGELHELSYSGTITLNNKVFKVYDGGYTDRSGFLFASKDKYYVNKKVLLYSMPSSGNLYIEIDGNGRNISNDIINQLVNFEVKEINY